jgi:hypothetical protein
MSLATQQKAVRTALGCGDYEYVDQNLPYLQRRNTVLERLRRRATPKQIKNAQQFTTAQI